MAEKLAHEQRRKEREEQGGFAFTYSPVPFYHLFSHVQYGWTTSTTTWADGTTVDTYTNG